MFHLSNPISIALLLSALTHNLPLVLVTTFLTTMTGADGQTASPTQPTALPIQIPSTSTEMVGSPEMVSRPVSRPTKPSTATVNRKLMAHNRTKVLVAILWARRTGHMATPLLAHSVAALQQAVQPGAENKALIRPLALRQVRWQARVLETARRLATPALKGEVLMGICDCNLRWRDWNCGMV